MLACGVDSRQAHRLVEGDLVGVGGLTPLQGPGRQTLCSGSYSQSRAIVTCAMHSQFSRIVRSPVSSNPLRRYNPRAHDPAKTAEVGQQNMRMQKPAVRLNNESAVRRWRCL